MEETKRQRQVGRLVQEEMSSIFLREGMNMVDGGMVSVSKVQMTPDLMEARVYLSFFQVNNPAALLHEVKERTGEWRRMLGMRVGKQLRRVPELHFFSDDTLEHVFKMENLFRKIQQERDDLNPSAPDNTPEA